MGDKTTFPQRLAELRLNPDALEEIRVTHPVTEEVHTIPNADGKRGSLQVYAAITSNDSRITPEAARRGLAIFGEELRAEARETRGFPDIAKTRHPSIDLLEEIASVGNTVPSYVIRRNPRSPSISRERLDATIERFGTPFILYDEVGIKQTLRNINEAFSWNPGFKEFFAVKACPNPYILEICKQEGAGADCSSGPELTLSNAVGLKGKEVMFTSNNTPASEFAHAMSQGAIINLDDITHIPFFMNKFGKSSLSDLEIGCVRYNPGAERVGNSIIGNPVDAKYGLTKKQVMEAFEMMKARGIKRFGLHTMVASNELNPEYHIETARMLFNLVREVKEETGIDVEFVNTGGGWGVNYKPEQKALNPQEVGGGVKDAYARMITASGLKPLKIFMENGRFITGPHGWLVTKAVHEKHTYKEYVGVDATMADFMRPGVYGAYHHISVFGKEHEPQDRVYDVVGSLCENSDKFAVNRALPKIEMGDIVLLHGAGAHGRAMGFNYNGKMRCGELLLRGTGKIEQIRRRETEKDYFATLSFPGSRFG